MNMVSIIIATYNSEKTLKRALDSVLNQSYQDWSALLWMVRQKITPSE